MGKWKHQLLRLSLVGGPWAGAVQGWELTFFPLQRVPGGFLLLGAELSPASLHKARKRISSFCPIKESKA